MTRPLFKRGRKRESESNATNRRGVEGDSLGMPASKSEMTGRLFAVSGVDSISSSIVDWRERVKDRECLLTFRSSKMQEKRFC